MRKLFAVSLVSFVLLGNVCASDLGNVKSEIENFVGIIAPQGNDNVFVDQVVQEFKVLFDDISVELETKLNKITAELEKKSDLGLVEKSDLILEGKLLLELKDSFLNAFNPILNVENYKDHHKRELKDSIEKFNAALENISNDNFVNNIFDKDGNLAKQLPTQDALLAKMQKLNASLYAILLEGKKLNEKRLDDILDIYYRMLLYTKNNKLKVGTITAVSALTLLAIFYYYKNRTPSAPGAPEELRMEEEVESDVEESTKVDISLDDFDLNKHVILKLENAGITTADELLNKKAEDLLKIKGIGQKTVDKVLGALEFFWKQENPALAAEYEEKYSNPIVDEVVESSSDGKRGLIRTMTMAETMRTVDPVTNADAFTDPSGRDLRKRDLDQ